MVQGQGRATRRLARRVLRPWYRRPGGLLLALIPAFLVVWLAAPSIVGALLRRSAPAGLSFQRVTVTMAPPGVVLHEAALAAERPNADVLSARRVTVSYAVALRGPHVRTRVGFEGLRWTAGTTVGGVAAAAAALRPLLGGAVDQVSITDGEAYLPAARFPWLAHVDATAVAGDGRWAVTARGSALGDAKLAVDATLAALAPADVTAKVSARGMRAGALDAWLPLGGDDLPAGTVTVDGAFQVRDGRFGGVVRGDAAAVALPRAPQAVAAALRQAFGPVVPAAAITRLARDASSPAAGAAATLTGTVGDAADDPALALLAGVRAVLVEGVANAMERAAAEAVAAGGPEAPHASLD